MNAEQADVLAQAVVKEFAAENELPEAARVELALRVAAAIRSAARAERAACVQSCNKRHVLWLETEGRQGAPEVLRTEARHRANEAAYLADLLASETPESPRA